MVHRIIKDLSEYSGQESLKIKTVAICATSLKRRQFLLQLVEQLAKYLLHNQLPWLIGV